MRDFSPISHILKKIIRDFGLQASFREFQIISAWENVVGKTIGKHTFAYRYQNKILFVKVDSSVWIQQLVMLKKELIYKINQKLEKKLVKEIIFKLAEEEEVRNKKWQK